MFNKSKKVIFYLFLTLLHSPNVSLAENRVIEINQYVPNVMLNGLTIKSRSIAEYHGKPLIINIWASWCGPCNDEMHTLERLNKRYGKNQFNLIGVSIDDDTFSAKKFVKLHRLSFDNFIDQNLMLENLLGAKTVPLTILINAKGRVVEKVYGSKDWMSNESKSLISNKFKIKLQ